MRNVWVGMYHGETFSSPLGVWTDLDRAKAEFPKVAQEWERQQVDETRPDLVAQFTGTWEQSTDEEWMLVNEDDRECTLSLALVPMDESE